jgi:hypothetical protein
MLTDFVISLIREGAIIPRNGSLTIYEDFDLGPYITRNTNMRGKSV